MDDPETTPMFRHASKTIYGWSEPFATITPDFVAEINLHLSCGKYPQALFQIYYSIQLAGSVCTTDNLLLLLL